MKQEEMEPVPIPVPVVDAAWRAISRAGDLVDAIDERDAILTGEEGESPFRDVLREAGGNLSEYLGDWEDHQRWGPGRNHSGDGCRYCSGDGGNTHSGKEDR